jgi:hypothetical protein
MPPSTIGLASPSGLGTNQQNVTDPSFMILLPRFCPVCVAISFCSASRALGPPLQNVNSELLTWYTDACLLFASDQHEEKRKARGPKLGKTQKADRFWFFGSHPGRRKRQASGGSGRDAAATMRGCSSIAPNTGAAHLQRKTQKSGQVLVRTRKDRTESIDCFRGGMSGVLKLSVPKTSLQGCAQPITLPSKIRPFSSLKALK